jgi:hypothetical protein
MSASANVARTNLITFLGLDVSSGSKCEEFRR